MIFTRQYELGLYNGLCTKHLYFVTHFDHTISQRSAEWVFLWALFRRREELLLYVETRRTVVGLMVVKYIKSATPLYMSLCLIDRASL